MIIIVAIGANLPGRNHAEPIRTCREAVHSIGQIPGLRLTAESRWYETVPQPPSGQPNFVNGVVRLDGDVAPEALLADLHALEAAAGRQRGAVNAARVLDLDIIAMGDIVRLTPDPVLPHPRAHLRRFVLVPLADVAPGWVHPGLGQTVEALLAALPEEPMREL